jgi:phosphonate transport system ATP-binding protein
MQSSCTAEDDGHLIRIDNVSVTYPGGHCALRAVTVGFRSGEMTALLGRSGAGKSTLLRTLNYLVPPTNGRVVSREFGTLAPDRALRLHRRRTAVIFQQHQLLARHSALDNVLIGRLAFHGSLRSMLPLPRADRELALTCLNRVGLFEKALTRADQLSGGEQQRVGIARALAQQPNLILADEPVASLDPGNAEAMLDLLRSICRADGIAAIVSLHQLGYAQRFADRVVGLADGRIVFDGAPAELDHAHLAGLYGAGEPRRNHATPRAHARPTFEPAMEPM